MTWQPIESAPKDGTYILVYPGSWKTIGVSVAKWDTDEYKKKPKPYWRRLDTPYVMSSRENPPTHWMPLPDPLAEEAP